MKFEDFKAGAWVQQYQYKSFAPIAINDEAVPDVEQLAPEKHDDWAEVHNYVQAINEAIAELEHLPLSNRLLKHTRSILMQGVRGENKTPGEFRISQNWIGGSGLKDAAFVPPHQSEVAALMGDLELFLR